MQKRAIQITFLILALTFLTSCDSISNLNIPFFSGPQQSIGKGIKVDILQAPKSELTQNEPFQFRMKVTNYNNQPVAGKLCLSALYIVPSDPLPSNDCKEVNLVAAEKGSDNKVIESTEEYYFPSDSATYQYNHIRNDVPQSAGFQANFRSEVSQKVSAPLCIKLASSKQNCAESESLRLTQTELPIKISSIQKETSPVGNNQISLKLIITLDQNQEGQIISKESVMADKIVFKPTVSMKPEFTGTSNVVFNCPGLEDWKFDMKANEKVIKCFATLGLNQEMIQENLVLNLDYGFSQNIMLPTVQLLPANQVNN